MAELVVTMVVGPLLSIVKEKVSNYLLDQYKVMVGMEEQHEILKRKLPAIMDILSDAEEVATHREGVAAWLQAMKKVVYQANEVFDEFKYEALRRKAKKEGHYKELGFEVVKLFPAHNSFVFRKRMGRRLRKIVQAIEALVTDMNSFGFKYRQAPQLSESDRSQGMDRVMFDSMNIISRSRDKDKKNIVDILVGHANNEDLAVVPIVGMGGLGKTTLAELVYNEPAIEEHFDLLLWVCVPSSHDEDFVAKSIVEAASEKNGTEPAASRMKKAPLKILQNVVSGQRYLLVLDDVCIRAGHKWEQLKACLEHGGMGSVVLTTTRDERVAEIMGTVKAYSLTTLEDKFIKEIIETRAFRYFHTEEERPTMLVNMVCKIVKRCCGSPLAATALGNVLSTKTTVEAWKAVSSTGSVGIGILAIIKLCYNDLPLHMKQCFAFCAIFPKDYEIDVDKLIQLWIAQGFIMKEKQVCLETTGKKIFNELASRSFFQDVKQVKATHMEIRSTGASYSRTTCKIHDLMHDVALSMMENQCALVVTSEEQSPSEWLTDTARHLFLSCKEPGKKLNSSLKNSSAAIQTLLCDSLMTSSLQHLSRYSSLQALQLCLERSFPLKLKYLPHLRYLDLSRSCIKALPADVTILYHLQTLNLSGCVSLGKLPRQMKYMTSLRHLYTHGCPELKSMPRDIGELTALQILTCFVAGSGSNCSNVGELGNLNLGGQLELNHLENVTEKDAEAAILWTKNELTELTLKWTVGLDDCFDETSCRDDARVLEKLRPHDGLHAIRIYSYGGTTFPAWMDLLQNIVEIHLFHCEKLQWLFSNECHTFFAIPNLKELTLEDLVCLERLWEINNDGMEEEIMFPLLEKLSISRCEKLIALPGHPTFPNLQNVHIWGCPELTTTAKSPKLSVLDMEGSEAELFLWVARHMTSLKNLELCTHGNSTETNLVVAEHSLREAVDGTEKSSDCDFPLAVLMLRGFDSGVTELCACFVHLEELSISSSDALVHWPEKEFQGLVSLRKLLIDGCKNLTGYVQPPVEPSTSSVTSQLLPDLESLMIWNCDSLVEVFNVPLSLRRMEIRGCSKLEYTFGRRVQQGQSASPIHQGPFIIPEVSPLSPRAGVDRLEELILIGCEGLTGVLHLPFSLKELEICFCGLSSLESCSGKLPFLERLRLEGCNTLSSMPDGPQSYSYLERLTIIRCPGIKTLPTSLQQRLGSLQEEHVEANYYENKPKPMLLKPETWKYAIRKD